VQKGGGGRDGFQKESGNEEKPMEGWPIAMIKKDGLVPTLRGERTVSLVRKKGGAYGKRSTSA